MVTISVSKTVSGAIALEIVAAICAKHNYQATMPNPDYNNLQWLDAPDNTVPNPDYDPNETIPNPETKQAFAQRVLDERFVQYGKNVLNWYRDQVAMQAVIKIDNTEFT